MTDLLLKVSILTLQASILLLQIGILTLQVGFFIILATTRKEQQRTDYHYRLKPHFLLSCSHCKALQLHCIYFISYIREFDILPPR